MKPCTKKKLTKKEAQEHLNHLQRRGNLKKGRIYPCIQCEGFWHITHTELLDKNERTVIAFELSMIEKWKQLIEK